LNKSNESHGKLHVVNEFDKPHAIFAAIILGFVGTAVTMGLPLLVGSIAESLHFSEKQLGWLASADMGGLFIGSVLTSRLVTRVNRRYLAISGLLLVMISNYLCTHYTTIDPLVLLRFAAGVGAGICYATCTASLAGSHNSARTFSIFLLVLVSINALIFYIFPIIDAKWGVSGLFLFFMLAAMPVFLVVPLIPSHNAEKTDDVVVMDEKSHAVQHIHIPNYLPWLCLAAVFSFYILVGAYWAFIERAGDAANIQSDFISGTLTWGQVFSITGTAMSIWMAKRFGQSKPLLFALSCMIIIMLVLTVEINHATFLFSVFSFSLFWIFIDVFQLGILSNIDHSGRYAALVPASQGAAQAIAPMIAGLLLSYQFGYGAVMFMCAVGAAVALLIYIFVYTRLLKIVPDIADSE